MTRQFIFRDTGEFGFSNFQSFENDKWCGLNLEVDCDKQTIRNFNDNPDIVFQYWINDEGQFCVASNFWGLKRQAVIPTSILGQLKVTFTAPAKGGAEFDLSIDLENTRGQIISGQINVKRIGVAWDNQDYYEKRKILEKVTEGILNLTKSKLTKTTEYINA